MGAGRLSVCLSGVLLPSGFSTILRERLRSDLNALLGQPSGNLLYREARFFIHSKAGASAKSIIGNCSKI